MLICKKASLCLIYISFRSVAIYSLKKLHYAEYFIFNSYIYLKNVIHYLKFFFFNLIFYIRNILPLRLMHKYSITNENVFRENVIILNKLNTNHI